MKLQLILICWMLLSCGSFVLGQNQNSDRCEVVAIDITGRSAENIDRSRELHLGTFDTVIGEEVETQRIYRLPNTRLFVIASVLYTDESMASTEGPESVSFELTVSVKPKRDILNSLIYADSEMPLYDFDVGRVTARIKTGRRNWMLMMECRKNVRR